MSYLKVHYANYFYANILSNAIGSEKKTAQMIDEAKHQKINILPPNINYSHWFYKATKKGIYLSIGAIKGVGYQSVKLIVEERKANGFYKDFFDFTRRIPKRIKTRKLLESLILVGAFDTFGKNRATLLNAIDQVLDDISDIEQDGFIFDVLTPKASYEEKEELPDHVLSEYEKEYLGFYVSTHPVEKAFEQKQYLGIYKLANAQDNKPIFVQVDQFKRIRTRNGQNMAFVTLNDGINNLDGVVFPDTFVKIFGRDSNRGVQAYQNLKNASSLLPHLNTYLGIINTEMFAGHLVLFLLAAAAAAFFLRQLHIRRAENSIRTRRLSDASRREQRKEKRTEHLLASQSACAALGIAAVDICIYTILIALIAPYQADRYIFCIFPVIAIGFTILICKIFSLTKEKKKGFQAACILLLVLVAGQWIQRTPGYLYTEKKNNVALSQQYSDKDCLYITYDYNRYLPTNNVLELQNYQRVLTVKVSGEDYMPIDSALQETMTSPVVYIDGMMNVSDVIQYITNAGGYTKSTEIYPDDKTYVIYFEK